MNKGTKNLIIIMSLISLIVIVGMGLYYKQLNTQGDPRLLEARKLLITFEQHREKEDYDNVLLTLDKMEAIYKGMEGYENSFEMGVVENNRGATYLAEALRKKTKEEQTPLLLKAKEHIGKGIEIYKANKGREMERRLSVSYTNLGIIARHEGRLEDALRHYKKALDLWSENHTAKNNLRVIAGEKPVKRSVIQQLFPPKKD